MAEVTERQHAPFKIGDRVVYTPSCKGAAINAAEPIEGWRLQPSVTYVVAEMNGDYVSVEGSEHPAGGLFWTEFRYANAV